MTPPFLIDRVDKLFSSIFLDAELLFGVANFPCGVGIEVRLF